MAPHVVSVFDAGTFQDHPFEAMELVDGMTLRRWLTTRPLPTPTSSRASSRGVFALLELRPLGSGPTEDVTYDCNNGGSAGGLYEVVLGP